MHTKEDYIYTYIATNISASRLRFDSDYKIAHVVQLIPEKFIKQCRAL